MGGGGARGVAPMVAGTVGGVGADTIITEGIVAVPRMMGLRVSRRGRRRAALSAATIFKSGYTHASITPQERAVVAWWISR